MTRLGVGCEALLDEIAFVAEQLDDQLVHEDARVLSVHLTRRTRNAQWDGVMTVEAE
jgi:hypothetical protein